ncbi:MAG: hypothetical protein HOE90_09210 [Bacteriovoracaceae bacterium]|jgi:PmbA protein|nr:hypothetical protein [Bacteriovoracaceae bacterium]
MRDIIRVRKKELSIEVAGNEITSIRNKNILKSGARVFKDGKVFSSSFVGDIESEKLFEQAISNTEAGMPYSYDLGTARSVSKSVITESSDAEKDFYESYKEQKEKLKKLFPEFIFSGKANLSRISKSQQIGDEISQELTFDEFDWYFIYKHKSSASIMDGYFGAGNIGKFELGNELDSYVPFLKKFTSVADVKNGEYPVVFVEQSSIYGKLLESFRIDTYQKNIGLYKGCLGNKILNEKLSIFDVSYDPEKNAMGLFDGEGFVRDNPSLGLVENGVMKNLICDLRNASKYDSASTGNGQRAYNSGVSLGFNKIIIGPGEQSCTDILKSLPECLIVEIAAGGDFTDTGDYSTPVQAGFMMRAGEVVGKLPQITLKTSVQKMFGDELMEISSDQFSGIDESPALFMNMEVIVN